MSWKNIVGHEAVIRLLKGQVTKDRLANTYLFVGPRGIGKRMLAVELAKAVECEAPRDGEACDVCEACRQVSQNCFPDVMTVSSESETGQLGIDQVRKLANWMALTPYRGPWKVGLVEDADRFTEEAAHACLKLLEEPPEQSLLIFVTPAPHRLPLTFISRCHIVRCAPQGIRQVALALKEREQLEDALSAMLAILSGGRLGLALQFKQEQSLVSKNAVVDQLHSALKQGTLEIPLGTSPRAEVEEALEWMAAWWRDLLLLQLGGDPSWVIHQDRLKDLKEEIGAWARPGSKPPGEAGGTGHGTIVGLLEKIEKTYWVQEAIQKNASPRIALSALLIQSSA